MSLEPLANLVRIGQLKEEPPDAAEIEGLAKSATDRLRDAERTSLSLASRFDLAYAAAHAFALAALRWHGFRAVQRYTVFQTTAHTLRLAPSDWRVLEEAHRKRNRMEYEGVPDVTEQLLEALLRVSRRMAEAVESLGPADPQD